MGYIYVDPTSLRAKMEELGELNEQFRAEVGNLKEIEQSLAGMWEGASKETFHNAFGNDAIQMNNFYNAIAQFISKLGVIIAKYETAEAKNIEIAATRSY